jgi:acetolactate synthase-1/2/3 large subunit
LVHAAEGYARTTGKTGVCLVTSGPGSTNLVTGIADANFDSVPLVCITGQVPTHLIGNDAFQEVDIIGITRNICKYGVVVRSREELPSILKKAFIIANSGKPGPVIIDIPKDVQTAMGSDEYPETVNIRGYKPNEEVHIGQLKKALQALKQAKRPVFLIGGGVIIAKAQREMTELVDLTGIPVMTTIMGKGAIPTNHPLYIGNIGMYGCYAANHAVTECDVLFSIGCRFNDRITGKVDKFAKNATIIHADIDPASISRNIDVDIPLVADAKNVISKMLELEKPHQITSWMNEINIWKEEYPMHMKQQEGITAEKIIRTINKTFDSLIMTTDVGQNQLWATQYVELTGRKRLITSGGLGTMGYGLPSAIGAQIAHPDETVICITGDGGFQMNIQEMATARLERLPIIICVFNNEYLGNVRQWQEMFYDRHYSMTCLKRHTGCSAGCSGLNRECTSEYFPDFMKIADAYGSYGIRVCDEAGIEPALIAAASHRDAPTIIEFSIERESNVLPIVPAGGALNEMIMDYAGRERK